MQAEPPHVLQDKDKLKAIRAQKLRDTASTSSDPSQMTVDAAQLPKRAVGVMLRRIEAGGPFPDEEDCIVFGNRERMLPPHPRGFYDEYTVPTPRARDRGARRIVCGGLVGRSTTASIPTTIT